MSEQTKPELVSPDVEADAEFAKRFPTKAAEIALGENNRDFMLDSIGARHARANYRVGFRDAHALLSAKMQQQALQYLSDNGQWIEETAKLRAAIAALKSQAPTLADADELMRLADEMVDSAFYCEQNSRVGEESLAAARSALHAALTRKDQA